LEEKIRWCRANDDKCREIASNCTKFYEKYVARSALLDYVEMVTKHIAKRQIEPPKWWSAPPPEQPPPKLNKPDSKCYEDRSSGQSRLCSRCQEEVTTEQRELEEMQVKSAGEKKSKQQRQKNLRNRMKKRAKTT
jgi:hypothetical protein